MNNCSHCGDILAHETNRHICKNCKKTFYDNPKAAVVIVLYASDRQHLLLARRAHDPEKGKIDFIGGFLDKGEDFEKAAYRELYEESGLYKDDISELTYFGSFYNAYLWEGTAIPTTSVCFMAEIKNLKDLQPSDDVASIEQVHISDLPVGDAGAWLDMDSILTLVAQRLAAM